RIQSSSRETAILFEHHEVLDQFGESDLCFQHVLLRNASDHILDPCRLRGLASQIRLLVMEQEFVLIAEQVVERLPDLSRDVASFGLQFCFDWLYCRRGKLWAKGSRSRTGH